MTGTSAAAPFSAIAPFSDFARIMDEGVYRPLPDDWVMGVTDVVGSTSAIHDGQYKAVNMAGAAAISAMMNALKGVEFPFAFGGDGSHFAVPGEHGATARDVLARTALWAADGLGMELRAGAVTVGEARAAGHEALVAWHAPSPHVRYAMFTGGAFHWAEERLKDGTILVPPAARGRLPDLDGLSCRWKPIEARRGVMLSLIVRPAHEGDEGAFNAAIRDLLGLIEGEAGAGHPVPEDGPAFGSPLSGLALEAGTRADGRSLAGRAKLLGFRLFAWGVMVSGLRVGSFDPARYLRETAMNSDFRKYSDALHMTLDCAPETADRIEAMLAAAETAGALAYGIFRQKAALMTCIVPSASSPEHFHFIDGADGGYAAAAGRLKALARGAA
ncbi:MAG: DUF3095 domain-containing protein [Pseudomonadota bacterium]|nr:DUF3095 domain-containing protein [Pseudomonadota bacterium]